MLSGLLIVSGSILAIVLLALAVNRFTLKEESTESSSWTPPPRELDLEAYNRWLRREVWGEKCSRCAYCWSHWGDWWDPWYWWRDDFKPGDPLWEIVHRDPYAEND